MHALLRWALTGAALLPVVAAAAVPTSQVTQGQAVFAHRCGMCHREGGTGTFILARRLGPAKSLLEKRTDLDPTYERTVVRWGLVNMPRISRVELPEPDLDALIAYLSAPKASAAP